MHTMRVMYTMINVVQIHKGLGLQGIRRLGVDI